MSSSVIPPFHLLWAIQELFCDFWNQDEWQAFGTFAVEWWAIVCPYYVEDSLPGKKCCRGVKMLPLLMLTLKFQLQDTNWNDQSRLTSNLLLERGHRGQWRALAMGQVVEGTFVDTGFKSWLAAWHGRHLLTTFSPFHLSLDPDWILQKSFVLKIPWCMSTVG